MRLILATGDAARKAPQLLLIDVIGDLLPSALAVALSPVPIIAVVLALGAPNARTTGPAFALGWIAGLVAVSAIVVLILGNGSDPDLDDPGVDWLKVAIGILFLVLASGQWKKRPQDDPVLEMPRWMASFDNPTPRRAVLLGAALSGANPKNLALTLAVAATIAEAGLDDADMVVAVVLFIALGSAAVGGPVLFYLIDADRAARPLAAIRRYMSENNAVITMVVLLLLGAKLLGDGLTIL